MFSSQDNGEMPLQLFEKGLQAFTRLLTTSLPGLQRSWDVASQAMEPKTDSVLVFPFLVHFLESNRVEVM